MSLLNSEKRFGSLAIALHWLTLLAFIAAYASMELEDAFPKGPARDLVKSVHFCAGLSVLLMGILRLGPYLRGPMPVIAPPLAAWQQSLARWMHRGLYLLMFLLPLFGWLSLSAKGGAISLPGFTLPALPLPATLAGNADAAHWFKEIHELLADLGYLLIGAHAGAALLHHYFLRDNTLTRMLPARRAR